MKWHENALSFYKLLWLKKCCARRQRKVLNAGVTLSRSSPPLKHRHRRIVSRDSAHTTTTNSTCSTNKNPRIVGFHSPTGRFVIFVEREGQIPMENIPTR
jgi:hypothetical protein